MKTKGLNPSDLEPRTSNQQISCVCDGNHAAARAILHAGYDGEGYYPITPSTDVGEAVSEAVAAGETDMEFVIGTSELAVAGIVTGMAIAGGRAVDVTSANGLLLKAEQMPVISGLGLPVVMNLSTRAVSAPLNIKNSHDDLAQSLGWGWMIFCASTVQAIYDLNLIALKAAEETGLPAIVAYDGFHTSHAVRKISVFSDAEPVRRFLSDPPPTRRPTLLDFDDPKTFGSYMNDDLINAKVQIEKKMEKAARAIPAIFQEYADLSGRKYDFLQTLGPRTARAAMVILNSAGETAKLAVERLESSGNPARLVMPTVLRPFPESEITDALGGANTILVAERVSQYGAGNFLANEIGAALQREGSRAKILQRTYGLGGLSFTEEDALHLFDVAARYPDVPAEERAIKSYHGAWAGDRQGEGGDRLKFCPLNPEDLRIGRNGGKEKLSLKDILVMPDRIAQHSACPGCGIFSNLSLFLRAIEGQVVLIFNTGCGMIVTTGFPNTSFKVPYFHNLFHNGASTATGVVKMIERFRRQGKLSGEVTVIVVTGDGGDDIGMDQVIGAALRDDPFIMIEYDNKGYMNTGGQLCYTGIKGQICSNARLGPKQAGKLTHHKDIIEILRGTHARYLFQAVETFPVDFINKAHKSQKMVREGHFVFGKVFSVCPLNWGMEAAAGPESAKLAVESCLFPIYEIENGITRINHDPEQKQTKVQVKSFLAKLGGAFRHLASEPYAGLAAEIQSEVDRRFARLKAMQSTGLA
ncbi:pyruvate synthase [bacterium]|nr:pyruvate synthase [bacterium]